MYFFCILKLVPLPHEFLTLTGISYIHRRAQKITCDMYLEAHVCTIDRTSFLKQLPMKTVLATLRHSVVNVFKFLQIARLLPSVGLAGNGDTSTLGVIVSGEGNTSVLGVVAGWLS